MVDDATCNVRDFDPPKPTGAAPRNASRATLTRAIRSVGSAKELARLVGCSLTTAERLRIGKSTLDPIRLTFLMRHSRAVRDAVLRMAGLDDASLDLAEARARDEMARLQQACAERSAQYAEVQAAVAALYERMVDQGD